MTPPEQQARLQTVHSHYRLTPWIRPRGDEAPLLRSWQRSRDAGLRETDRVGFELVSRSLLAELDDRHGDLVRAARPEADRLAASLQGTGAAVLLFNPRGAVIDRLCDEPSTPTPLRTATRVGVNLAERCMGTTAPSIVLAEGEPYLVGRDAHFCASLRPFFCVAAPIDSPRGERLGALDVTSFDSVPSFDVFSLVVDAATAIENSLFAPGPQSVLVHFHPRAELVGTPLEGIVELDDEGQVRGANRAAARLLCLPREDLLRGHARELFERDLGRVFAASAHARRGDLVTMQSRSGLQVEARFEGAATRTCVAVSASPASVAAPPKLCEVERDTIDRALAAHAGNVSAAAAQLGVSRNTIYRKRSAPTR